MGCEVGRGSGIIRTLESPNSHEDTSHEDAARDKGVEEDTSKKHDEEEDDTEGHLEIVHLGSCNR